MALEHQSTVGWLALIGAAVGIGQLLASEERLTIRIVVGRAICSAGLGASCAAAGLIFPDVNPIMSYGLAALVASLGTSGLEVLLKTLFRVK